MKKADGDRDREFTCGDALSRQLSFLHKPKFTHSIKIISNLYYIIKTLLNPLVPMVPLSSLVLKENTSVVESVRNLDAKCEVQRSACIFCS